LASDPSPPPLPEVHAKAKARRGSTPPVLQPAAVVAAAPASAELLLPTIDLHRIRTRIAWIVQRLENVLLDGAEVDIGGLTAKVDLGGESVAVGPAPFSLARRQDVLRMKFVSDKTPSPGKTPLTIDAEIPLGPGDVTAHLEGGPVSLSQLGVKEGTKGLLDVDRGTVSGKGTVVLSSSAEAATFDGEVELRAISLKQPRVANETLRDLGFALAARGVLDDQGRWRLDASRLDMGALHVTSHGTMEEDANHLAVALAIDVAQAPCQALLESAPAGLLPILRTARMGGTFGLHSRLVVDTRALDKLVLDYDIDDKCRMVDVPREIAVDRFSTAFTYRTYLPDGTASETTTGPDTAAWTSLDAISPFMIAAVLTTEDGAFYKHRGFNHHAIRSSFAANLKARRFVRGASTITMQLAKNLFLARDKTLSRKLEELILADYLEQSFRKDDMMELYLNVIEFGPDVYGVRRAADYYFGRTPEELNLAECLFLSSIMPSPLRYGKMHENAEVPEGWLRHLRALMQIAAKTDKISDAELAEGLTESVVFHHASEPRPTPRKPVTGSRRDSADSDAPWQPLD
jgi:hypothetical protein